ncbi:MAG: diaminopimelate epimerase [Bdellovibrionales bacterium]
MSEQSTQFPIIKVSATGNDFLLIDLVDSKRRELWDGEFSQRPRAELALTWCDRHEGLGADGLVILDKDKSLDFVWDFYNSDGGNAEMCGNAARAVALYFHKKSGKPKITFGTRVGEVNAVIHGTDDIEVTLPPVLESEWNQLVDWQKGAVHFDFIRAGVPHAVVKVPHLENRPGLREFALALKEQPRFLKEGVNVTFVHQVSEKQINSVTFERGVEDFTRACGTGAIAAAYSLVRGEDGRQIEVQVPGGKLFVIWKNGRPHLRGPAKIIAEMRVIREA